MPLRLIKFRELIFKLYRFNFLLNQRNLLSHTPIWRSYSPAHSFPPMHLQISIPLRISPELFKSNKTETMSLCSSNQIHTAMMRRNNVSTTSSEHPWAYFIAKPATMLQLMKPEISSKSLAGGITHIFHPRASQWQIQCRSTSRRVKLISKDFKHNKLYGTS